MEPGGAEPETTVLSRSNINVPSFVRDLVSFIMSFLPLLSLSNSHEPNVTGMESTQLMKDKGVLFSPVALVDGTPLIKAEGGRLLLYSSSLFSVVEDPRLVEKIIRDRKGNK